MSAIGYARELWERYNPRKAYRFAVSTRRRQLLSILLVAILIALFYIAIFGFDTS